MRETVTTNVSLFGERGGSEHGSMPDPVSVSESSSEAGDPMDEDVTGVTMDEVSADYGLLGDLPLSFLAQDAGGPAHTISFDWEIMANTAAQAVETELYGSGASHHMTSYRHRLFNFVEIVSMPIMAADDGVFLAVSRGDQHAY